MTRQWVLGGFGGWGFKREPLVDWIYILGNHSNNVPVWLASGHHHHWVAFLLLFALSFSLYRIWSSLAATPDLYIHSICFSGIHFGNLYGPG